MRFSVRDVVLLMLSGVLWVVSPSHAMICPERLAESLCSRIEDESDLESKVYASVLYIPEARSQVLKALKVGYYDLSPFNAVLLHASLEEMRRMATINGVEYVEELAMPAARRVRD